LYDRADFEPKGVDFAPALRRVGIILVFLRGIPHKSGSNVRDANKVADSQAREQQNQGFFIANATKVDECFAANQWQANAQQGLLQRMVLPRHQPGLDLINKSLQFFFCECGHG
jgi:hypothetical protein